MSELNERIEELETMLEQYVSFKSLGIAKMMYLSSENIHDADNPDEVLKQYVSKLEAQLGKRNDLGVFVDKCLICNKTKLLDQWGDWEYTMPILFSHRYCSAECMSIGMKIPVEETRKYFK